MLDVYFSNCVAKSELDRLLLCINPSKPNAYYMFSQVEIKTILWVDIFYCLFSVIVSINSAYFFRICFNGSMLCSVWVSNWIFVCDVY